MMGLFGMVRFWLGAASEDECVMTMMIDDIKMNYFIIFLNQPKLENHLFCQS